MTISTIPAVLNTIVAAARRRLPDVRVVDGQPVKGQEDAEDILCVAFTGTPGEAAVRNVLTREQMTADPYRESYVISNLASSWRGEQDDPEVVRAAAYALVDGFVEALADDLALQQIVMRAMVTAEDFAQEQTTKGAVATVGFDVHVDAYTR